MVVLLVMMKVQIAKWIWNCWFSNDSFDEEDDSLMMVVIFIMTLMMMICIVSLLENIWVQWAWKCNNTINLLALRQFCNGRHNSDGDNERWWKMTKIFTITIALYQLLQCTFDTFVKASVRPQLRYQPCSHVDSVPLLWSNIYNTIYPFLPWVLFGSITHRQD